MMKKAQMKIDERIEALQDRILAEAEQLGFRDAEVTYQSSQGVEVLLMEGEVSRLESNDEAGVSFRGSFHGQMGYAHSEKLTEDSITDLLLSAQGNAMLMSDGQEESLFEGEKSYPMVSTFSPKLEGIDINKQIKLARRMEDAALHGADHIALLDYCAIGMEKREISLRNSKGLSANYTKNFATGYVSAIAKAGEETKTGSYFWKGKDWAEFQPEIVGKEAAQRAVALLHAQSVPSGKYPVILNPEAMNSLLGAFCGAFYGENVQKGFSLLKDKEKTAVAAECVSLRDDALLIDGYASVPFDSEGVACKNKAVIEKGVLKTFLYNRKTAQRAGVSSTGNGFKAGLTAQVGTACTNFYITAGESTPEDMKARMRDGLVITGLMGLHSGANMVSGDFSLSAEGFLMEGGQVTHPVEQITVAGNFYQLLQDVVAVGDNLTFGMGGKGSPSVWVRELSVAGA